MSEIALYRKYRPQNFKNLVGQDHVRTTVLNALKEEHVSHAYLFCGPRGTGKTTTARLIVKALNCLNPREDCEPCEECDICTDISEGRLIDMIEIDAASNRGIDEIRDLKEKINFAPTRAKNKVYIIDEVHMLTKEAFNALLKTLEEPPSHTFFILCTTEVHKIPETILSRCQRFDFRRIDVKTMMTRLSYIAQTEGIEVEDRAIEAICRNVDGGLRDAIGLLDQLTIDGKLTYQNVRDILGITDLSTVENLYSALLNKDPQAGLSIIQNLHTEGTDFSQFVREFLDFLRNMMLEKVDKGESVEVAGVLGLINIFQETSFAIKTSSIPQLPLEIAVLKCCQSEISEQKPEKEKVQEKEVGREHKSVREAPKKTVKAGSAKQSDEKIPLTISYVKENWPRVLENVAKPFIRRSLSDAHPVQVEDNKVTLELPSKFHLEKVLEHEGRVETEKAFEKVFSEKVKILGSLKKVELASESSDLASDAAEIFGGELIDE